MSRGGSGDGRGFVREDDTSGAAAPAIAVGTSSAAPAAGPALWTRTFAGSGKGSGARAAAIAADREGNVVVAGSFAGTVSFGGMPLTSAGEDDVFVVKLDRTGKHLWSKRFGGPGYQDATGVAVDDRGEVVVVGTMDQEADFGGGTLKSAGMIDLFVARLDAGGEHLWSRRFGDEHEQEAAGVAVDRDGAVVFVGSYEGSLDFGSGPLASAGEDDVFVAKLDRAGKEVWSRRFGDERAQKGRAVAVDRDGAIVVAGAFRGKLALGAASLASPDADVPFVAKLDAAGKPSWARAWKGERGALGDARALAVGGDGAITVGGTFRGRLELSGSSLDGGGEDGRAFVARFEAGGEAAWGERFGDDGALELGGLAATADGDVLVVASPAGALDAAARPAAGEVVVARLDRKGHTSTSQRLGAEPRAASGVALDPSGRVLLAGGTRVPVDVVAGPLAGRAAVVLELRR
jgi:hypothetical protein